MPTPHRIDLLPGWTAQELGQLPSAEDEWHEYKSSAISFADLRKEIAIAASGFWNSGGGLLAAGVDSAGKADGGVDGFVGRQPLRDWADQCVAEVSPAAAYRVGLITDPALGIAPNKFVLLVGFDESYLAPHMAPDKRYYIRAGAHTVPAPHFIVEALMARRGLTQPLLRPILRHSPAVNYVLQLGIVAASSVPALDVTIELPPLEYLTESAPTVLRVGVISPETPFFVDFHVLAMGAPDLPPFEIRLAYHDTAGRPFTAAFEVDVASQLGRTLAGDPGNRDIVRQLDDIERGVKEIAGNIKNNEHHLRTIASKLR